MDGGCVRMSGPGTIPDDRLLQERTLPHVSSDAIRNFGTAHEDQAQHRGRCSLRCRRPGSPSGALLPLSQETGLSVGSAVPHVTGTGLTVGNSINSIKQFGL
ncbi:hypothetical protein NDU88_005513 [Pleurodeles waltl]|uniref:Uncharacterized protein n=1 Tax=Pleurodeles waltl TaxID=8319 RepID=A0AAV7SLX3_PLEWA|nr:hypothetical protein NDU88_005513 [Pleurodeles waltl]